MSDQSQHQDTAPLLSSGQRKLIATALGCIAVAVIILLICAGIAALGKLLSLFSSVLWPLAAAGIIALILRPCVDFLQKHLSLNRLPAVILLYGLFALACAGLLLALIPPLVGQAVDFFNFLPALWEKASNYVSLHYPDWVAVGRKQWENPAIKQMATTLLSHVQDMAGQALPTLLAAGGSIAAVFGFITRLAIIPIYLFFFLLSRAEPSDKLADHLPFLKKDLRDDILFLVREFVNIVTTFFRGQLLIGLCMGVLLSLGFTIVGLKFGLILGLTLGLLNIIPYLGTIIGLLITLPLAFFQPGGGWALVLAVLVVKVVVQSIEGWFLTPKIMGDRTGLHPVAIIFALFFWGVALNGIFGMVLAIPLTAFFVTVWRLLKHKYWA